MANPLTLESVSTAFDHWRQNRTSRKESVPISLREHAIKLLAHHSKSRVIEALKINHSMLKQWRHKGERSAPTFVVLPPPKPEAPGGNTRKSGSNHSFTKERNEIGLRHRQCIIGYRNTLRFQRGV